MLSFVFLICWFSWSWNLAVRVSGNLDELVEVVATVVASLIDLEDDTAVIDTVGTVAVLMIDMEDVLVIDRVAGIAPEMTDVRVETFQRVTVFESMSRICRLEQVGKISRSGFLVCVGGNCLEALVHSSVIHSSSHSSRSF